MAKYNYLYQCPNGHTGLIPFDSPLEEAAIKRIKQGYLDLIIVPSDECEYCCNEVRNINLLMEEDYNEYDLLLDLDKDIID